MRLLAIYCTFRHIGLSV